MEQKLFIAGFGGQGVMVIGQMLSYTAAETTDLNVTYFPAYGVEQRGGTANCSVIISEGRIGEPRAAKYNNMMILNNASAEKFLGNVTEDGLLLINSNVVTTEINRTTGKTIFVPANDLAIKAGAEKSANLVMAGAFIGYTEIMPKENVILTIRKKLGAKRPELNEINEKAFMAGYEIGQNARK